MRFFSLLILFLNIINSFAEGTSFSMPKDIALWANPLSALTLKETFEIVFKIGLADPLTFPHFKCKQ